MEAFIKTLLFVFFIVFGTVNSNIFCTIATVICSIYLFLSLCKIGLLKLSNDNSFIIDNREDNSSFYNEDNYYGSYHQNSYKPKMNTNRREYNYFSSYTTVSDKAIKDKVLNKLNKNESETISSIEEKWYIKEEQKPIVTSTTSVPKELTYDYQINKKQEKDSLILDKELNPNGKKVTFSTDVTSELETKLYDTIIQFWKNKKVSSTAIALVLKSFELVELEDSENVTIHINLKNIRRTDDFHIKELVEYLNNKGYAHVKVIEWKRDNIFEYYREHRYD